MEFRMNDNVADYEDIQKLFLEMSGTMKDVYDTFATSCDNMEHVGTLDPFIQAV